MIYVLCNALQQVIYAIFYLAVIIIAVKFGIKKAKMKNLKEKDNVVE